MGISYRVCFIFLSIRSADIDCCESNKNSVPWEPLSETFEIISYFEF